MVEMKSLYRNSMDLAELMVIFIYYNIYSLVLATIYFDFMPKALKSRFKSGTRANVAENMKMQVIRTRGMIFPT